MRWSKSKRAVRLGVHVSTALRVSCSAKFTLAHLLVPLFTTARVQLRRRYPEQRQGEETGKAPADADRDHGCGGEGEDAEESCEESGEGASTHPSSRFLTLSMFPSQHPRHSFSHARAIFPSFFLPCSSLTFPSPIYTPTPFPHRKPKWRLDASVLTSS